MPRKQATTWKMYEWEYLAKLLQKGYPFIDCLTIMRKDTTVLTKKLTQGIELADGILPYASDNLAQHLTFFLSLTSFANAIQYAIHMVGFENNMKKKLKKETAYPIFIFFFAYVTLFFFIQFVIPQLLLSFPLESLDMFFVISIYLLKFLCLVIGISILISVFAYVYYQKNTLSRKMLQPLMKFSLCKEYISYIFSSYLKELEADGLSTKAAISYLVNVPSKPMFTLFIHDIQNKVEQGSELPIVIQQHPYLCEMFQMNFAIGVKTGTLADCLEDYLIFQEERWLMSIHRASTLTQVISYGFVGFLVIMVYQILLVPLQLLESM